MIPGDPTWAEIDTYDPRWSQMARCDPRCFQMKPKWSQLLPNDPRWSHVIRNPSKSFFNWLIADAFSQCLLPVAPSWITKQQCLGASRWGYFLFAHSCPIKYVSYVVGGRVGMGVTHYIVRWYDLDPTPATSISRGPNRMPRLHR